MSRHLRQAIDEIGDPGPTLAEVLSDEQYALDRRGWPHTRTEHVDPVSGRTLVTTRYLRPAPVDPDYRPEF